MQPPPPVGARYRALHAIVAAGLPLVVLAVFVLIKAGAAAGGAPPAAGAGGPAPPSGDLRSGPPEAVTVVVVIDSLREALGRDTGLMPNVVELGERGLRGPLHTCFANFTLPCLLTTFEGRESPFLTSLSNFSAEATSNPNWFAALRAQGLRTALLSDHTLVQLYPGTHVSGGSYEDLRIPQPERDVYAFEQTLAWLDAREHDVVVTHVINTDKAAHTFRPDSAEYQAAFSAADRFVGDVVARLDLTRDTLLVFGDHGHGDEGHHDRQAWYAMAGPDVPRAELPLEQTSLYYVLARIHGLGLPDGYEGDLVWAARGPSPQEEAYEARWRAHQGQRWGLGTAITREALDTELARRHAEQADQPRRDALAFLPWWLHIVLIATSLVAAFQGLRPFRPGWLSWQLGWLAAVWLLPWSEVTVWLALPLQLWLSWPRPRGWAGSTALVLWSALAMISGLLIPWVVDTFHVRGGFSWVIPAWFGATIGLPMILGALAPRGATGSRWSQAGLVALAVAALLPAPGVYYYGVAQSVSHLLIPAAAIAILLEARPLRGARPLLGIAFVSGAAFVAIRAGGWDWRYRVQLLIEQWPTLAQYGLAALCVVLAGLVWARRSRIEASIGVVLLLLDGWLLHSWFEYESWRIGGFALLILSVTAGLALLEPPTSPTGGDTAEPKAPNFRTAWQVTLLVGIAFLMLWSASDGFFLKNLRMEFALRRLQTRFNSEADLAAATAVLVVLRYALVVLPPLLAAGLTLGSARLMHLGRWVVVICCFKILAQGAQTVGVQFVETTKSSELLIQETIGVAFLTLTLWSGLLFCALYRHGKQWALGRHRVP